MPYIRDIVERNHVANIVELGELVNVLASAVGSLTNPSRLQNTFRSVKRKSIDDKTIASYIGYLEDAYLVSEAQRYDIKGRSYIGSPKKRCFEDVGLRKARIGFRRVWEITSFSSVVVRGAMRPRREYGITYMGIRDFLLDEGSLDL